MATNAGLRAFHYYGTFSLLIGPLNKSSRETTAGFLRLWASYHRDYRLDEGELDLVLDPDWPDNAKIRDDQFWNELCVALTECVPKVRAIRISLAQAAIPGDMLAKLIGHMPGLKELRIECSDGSELERCFQLLEGFLMTDLQVLFVTQKAYSHRRKQLSLKACKSLAALITTLPALRYIRLSCLTTHWKPIVDAIRCNPSLESVSVCGWLEGGPTHEDDKAMRYGPRLCEAKRLLNSSGGSTTTATLLERWVEAVISVRDRVDCLDYLLTAVVDPHVWATAAVKALQQNAKQK